ncbi:MAG: ribosomal-protein-alanine N-acetyltransferase [Thermoprotei archaeon]|nr:MAG: ribosomal-protein-alanine N-acetyltransferase [Thermoprotei archaeon]RLF24605.1 MAG: ribosomal-protein-alanine N-acetyltransferase [Thermoprotei archaeon]
MLKKATVEVRLKDGSLIRIRNVKLEDLEQVYDIERASFKDPYPPDLLRTLALFHNDTFLVAVYGDKVVGYVIGAIRWDVIGHILNIAVHPDYRRRGIGSILMKEIMKRLKEKGARIYRLEVRVSNTPAQHLYERLGFRKAYVIKGYYNDGEDCYVMLKEEDEKT